MVSVDRVSRVDQAGCCDGNGRLRAFPSDWYGCLTRRADALFALADALLCIDGLVSYPPRLSLEPVFGCGGGSVYAALVRGGVDERGAAGAGRVPPGEGAGGVRGGYQRVGPLPRGNQPGPGVVLLPGSALG